MQIRPFDFADENAVISLWQRCGLLRPWNNPQSDIRRKMAVQPELFLVGVQFDAIVATAMVGYDGHRGSLYYLCVAPDLQKSGLGRILMDEAERRLIDLGCPKLNLQIRTDNLQATAFYNRLGYTQDAVVSYGKRFEDDTSPV